MRQPSTRNGRGGAAVSAAVRSAAQSIITHPARSLLTVSGVVIGVVSIVTITAILQGVKREVRSQLEGLGANVVIVVPGQLDSNGQPNPMAMMGISTLTLADAAALKAVPGVVTASPVIFVAGTASRSHGKSASAFVVATSPGGMRMNPSPIVAGRYFTASEANTKVCVLADRPRRDLFGRSPAVGHRIWVRGDGFRVVGVLGKAADEGLIGSHLLGLGDLVYLPLDVSHRLFPGGEVNRIVLKTDYLHPADRMINAMDAALRTAHHGANDFGVITQKRGLALVIRLLDMVQALLVLVSGISLLVAGVGIMNVMLLSVNERTREIGIRKTVGARRSDLFFQFLTEAMAICMAGSFIGLAISWLVCVLIARFAPLAPVLSGGLIAATLAVCCGLGVAFGVLPASRAARMDPIDAVRHE